MTLYPGDYLDNVTIERCDAWQGAGIFRYGGNDCFLLNSDVPEITLTPNLIIKRLVCVRYDDNFRRFRCLPPDSHQRIAEALFNTARPDCAIVRKYSSAWATRWEKAALDNEKVQCRPLDMPCHVPRRRWVLLKHEKWEMPVPACSQFDEFQGEYHFFPSCMQNLFTSSSTHIFISPAYRAYDECMKADRLLNARMELAGGGNSLKLPMPVTIIIHPFISPLKFHFGVWKHVFAPGNRQEKQCWDDLLEYSGTEAVPEEKEIAQIFSSCRIKGTGTSCKACDNGQFRQVHDRIEPWLKFYCRKAVTFFHEYTTDRTKRLIFLAEKIIDRIYHVQLTLDSSMAENADIAGLNHCASKFSRCICRGTMFTDGQKAVMHINPVTLYFTSGRATLHPGRNSILGTLSNVQKSD